MVTRKSKASAPSAENATSGSETGPRAAVVDACRTPFVKSFGVFENETPLALSLRAASALLARNAVDPADIGECIWGAVVPQTKNGNVARDVILYSGLPREIPGYTLNRACASSVQTVQAAADSIRLGRTQVVLAGGVEVLSDVPITFSDEARKFLMRLSKARSVTEKLMLFKSFKPKAFLPVTPAIAEPYTGLTMGESAEIMAVKNDISRERQDVFAEMSHKRAAKAIAAGDLKDELIPVWAGKDRSEPVEADNLVRPDTTVDALGKIKPAFDKRHGTLTAGNSTALTDGASAALIASEDYCREKGLPMLGFVKDALTVAVDPKDQLLIGPAIAIPKLLERNGLKLEDVGVYEIHEAFAAQVLSCLDSMASDAFCQERIGMEKAFGRVPYDKLNLDGGSLAFGHPFAATGIRLVSRALRIAKRENSRYAVIGVCAAGGLAQAMLLETH